MAQFFSLIYDTTAPQNGVITVLDYYKDNSTPITLSVTGAQYMKIWINQTEIGTTSDSEYPSDWQAYSSSWTPNFSAEGTNYIHAIFMDKVGNKTVVVNSNATVFDKTAPVVSVVSIASGVDVITTQNAVVRVTVIDANPSSGILKTTLSGDLDVSSTTEFTWSSTDRTNGYKDCAVVLAANSSTRETKTVYATATDNAGNTSERNSDTIVLYTGGIDPVIVLKDTSGNVIGEHFGDTAFRLQLQVLTGDVSLLAGYKVWGDFADTESSVTPTTEPENWTNWPTNETTVSLNKYLTALDGTKTINGSVRLIVSSIANTVATYADLPASANDGDIYKVTTDETKSNATTAYKYSATNSAFEYYGILEDGDSYAYHSLETTTVHHSEAEPTIVLTSAKSVISDKDSHNSTVLTAAFTTSCNMSEYKVVAYATQAAAQSGTSADVTNVELSGTTEIASGSSWTPTLLESKLILAVAGEGQKFIVVYGKNLCSKWGKSNIIAVTVDLTAPTGTIAVNQYYNAVAGFTASAADSVCSVSKMQAWVDTSAGTETAPATSTEYDYSTNPTSAQVDWTGVSEGNNYVHIKYTDEVGNSAVIHSSAFIYDTVAPISCSVTGPAKTNTTSVTLTLFASDVTSGMGYMKIYGDVSGAATADAIEWSAYTTSASITLSNTDGTKTVNVLFKDNAGNVISSAVSCSIILDTDAGSPTITLYNNADTAVLGTVTNVADFKAHISINDPSKQPISEIAYYKIYGDITAAATEDAASWVEFNPVSGQTYMSVGASLTTGDGSKTVTVKLKDDAGNVSTAASAVVELDTTAPVVDVNGVDYNVISKVHEPRLTSSGAEIANTYCDKMTFKFSADSALSEYKVCVNETGQQASTATAIGTSGGSINMTGTNLAANTEVTCVIMGADFAATLKVADTDGAYEIIVYGKDLAGNWSAIHSI